jgi:hypothetical protein
MSREYSFQKPLVRELNFWDKGLKRIFVLNAGRYNMLIEDFPKSIRKTFIFSCYADPYGSKTISLTYRKLSYEDLGWV